MSNERPRGPMGRHGRGMSGEKAKNFKRCNEKTFYLYGEIPYPAFYHAAVCGRKHHF